MDNNLPNRNIHDALFGAWRIVQFTEGGQESPREDGDDQFLWFLEEVIVTGDQWATWEMPYTLRGDFSPKEIDIMRKDLSEPWLQLGIIEVSGEALQICVCGSPDKPRPKEFSSSVFDQQVLYVAERCDEPLPE